jgi:two-component system, NtrC family, nitrogen regulation sensor histidine kinase GlnL
MQVPAAAQPCLIGFICYSFQRPRIHIMKTIKPPSASVERQISWEQILSNVEDGVITLDRSGKVSFFNEAAEMLTELAASRALSLSFLRIFRKEPWLVELIQKSFPPVQESARGEGDLVSRWGKKVPVGVTVSPLLEPSGNCLGSILLVRNLTHHKELEEDLKRADRLAMVGTLAAGLAHEIRNPLGGIKGAAQLLRRSLEPDSSLVEYTNIMNREVDRVNLLIEQLLDLSRPAKLEIVPLNIHQVLEDVLLLELKTQTGPTINVNVKKLFDPSLPPIQGDRNRLTQVFLNLVKNGYQAMNGSGTLTITTRLETDRYVRGQGTGRSRFIWVEIADQGIGIKDEDLLHIFSPFFTTKNNGTGLGLAVCYWIIKEHGGIIRVESIEGKGSTFKVSLVVAD